VLHLEDNVGLSCYPNCLNDLEDLHNMTVDVNATSELACRTPMEMSICSLVAATDVGIQFGSYGEWSCGTDGRPRTNPCSAYGSSWNNIGCSEGKVVSISLWSLTGESEYDLMIIGFMLLHRIDSIGIG
jgi:hypothetical protein